MKATKTSMTFLIAMSLLGSNMAMANPINIVKKKTIVKLLTKDKAAIADPYYKLKLASVRELTDEEALRYELESSVEEIVPKNFSFAPGIQIPNGVPGVNGGNGGYPGENGGFTGLGNNNGNGNNNNGNGGFNPNGNGNNNGNGGYNPNGNGNNNGNGGYNPNGNGNGNNNGNGGYNPNGNGNNNGNGGYNPNGNGNNNGNGGYTGNGGYNTNGGYGGNNNGGGYNGNGGYNSNPNGGNPNININIPGGNGMGVGTGAGGNIPGGFGAVSGVLGGVLMVVDQLVAIGQQLIPTISQGKAIVTNTPMAAISVLPLITTKDPVVHEMGDWSIPVTKRYQIKYTNGFGGEAVSFIFSVTFQYGGNYGGKGKYLAGVRVAARDVVVNWGFDLDAASQLIQISNVGTADKVIAGATVEMNYTVKNWTRTLSTSEYFHVTGDGKIYRLDH